MIGSTFSSLLISQILARNIYVTSILKCFISMRLSFAIQIKPSCLRKVCLLLYFLPRWPVWHLWWFFHFHHWTLSWPLLQPLLLCLLIAWLFSLLSLSLPLCFRLAYFSLLLLTPCNIICLIWNNIDGMFACIFILYDTFYMHSLHSHIILSIVYICVAIYINYIWACPVLQYTKDLTGWHHIH